MLTGPVNEPVALEKFAHGRRDRAQPALVPWDESVPLAQLAHSPDALWIAPGGRVNLCLCCGLCSQTTQPPGSHHPSKHLCTQGACAGFAARA
jgi:hypothetical protein